MDLSHHFMRLLLSAHHLGVVLVDVEQAPLITVQTKENNYE